ncbi:hypothetical protein CW745_02745 [Psychromonas sp. psych-6C06]|uniref:substrate-binding periplasmic protein n=1 Tax=Psychromonas sp. psych-6C06 TaxID=2058089 RepID=UPI000C33D26E|nr:transporter substrate-binding domain-containing protein [Psychromonas sp. psych-6C06]PKF63773.1 hypothetical protein CW745_02745 [Psychromonas sp. psych-6C06]
MKASLVLILFWLSASAFACPTKLRIGWTEWAPLHYMEEGELRGKSTDIIKTVLGKMGCQYTFIETPWVRLMRELEVGNIDIIAGVTFSDERAKFAWFSHVTDSESLQFFGRKDDPRLTHINTLDALLAQKLRIGLRHKVEYGETLMAQLEDQEVMYFNKGQLDKLLLRRRIDVIIFNDHVADMAFNQENLVSLNLPDLQVNITHLMLSKKTIDKHFLKKMNIAIDELTEQGVLRNIHMRYENY